MAYEIVRIDGAVFYIRITGVMSPADLKSLQTAGLTQISRGVGPRLLVTLEGFQGWQKGVDWGDVDFVTEHGDDIAKIAFVGDERWKEEVFAFVGKGLRTTEIEFFSPSSSKEAEKWIRE